MAFQFTHPRGVRLAFHRYAFDLRVFQFTHPRGVRHELTLKNEHQMRCFNSRTHEGCDSLTTLPTTDWAKFQFTHPRGVRPIDPVFGHWGISFNSRTHEGCDRNLAIKSLGANRFNSRTREGCDHLRERYF